jgi:peptidoglycan/LPS O-acetylase OafA/YrhL
LEFKPPVSDFGRPIYVSLLSHQLVIQQGWASFGISLLFDTKHVIERCDPQATLSAVGRLLCALNVGSCGTVSTALYIAVGFSAMKKNQPVLPWIQSLRGLAALLVVLVHARFSLPGATGQYIADNFLLPGASGVDLFFIVSGFIMVLTTKNCDGTAGYVRTFVIKRVARIWPLYLCVSAITLWLAPSLLSDAAHIRGFLKSLLLLPADSDGGLYLGMPVGVSWTLCYEVYFYLVLAVSMLFGRWRWLVVGVWFLLTLVAYPLYAGNFNFSPFGQHSIHWLGLANVAVNPIVWDFLAGLVGGAIYLSNFRVVNSAVQWVYLLLLASLTAIIIKLIIGSPSPHGMIGYGAPWAVFFVSMVLLSKAQEISVPRWSIWLGNISFSLYLTHLFGFRMAGIFISHFQIGDPTKIALCNFVANIVFGIVAGAVAYNVVEKPLSSYVQTKLLVFFSGPKIAGPPPPVSPAA